MSFQYATQYATELRDFQEVLKSASPKDFDGHTEFSILPIELKLCWLAQCALFSSEISQKQ